MDKQTHTLITDLMKRVAELENKVNQLNYMMQEQPEIIKQALIDQNRLPATQLFNANH
jgi:hypothetical protein